MRKNNSGISIGFAVALLSSCVASTEEIMESVGPADTLSAPTPAPPDLTGVGLGCVDGAIGVFEITGGSAAGVTAARAVSLTLQQQLAQAAVQYAAADSIALSGASAVTAAGEAGAIAFGTAAAAGAAAFLVVAGTVYLIRQQFEEEACKARITRTLVNAYIAAYGKQVVTSAIARLVANDVVNAVGVIRTNSRTDQRWWVCPSVTAGGLVATDGRIIRGQGTPTTSGGWNMCNYDYLPLSLVQYNLTSDCRFGFTETIRNVASICFTQNRSSGTANQTGAVPRDNPTNRFAFNAGERPDSWPIGQYALSMGTDDRGNFYQAAYPYAYGNDAAPGRLVSSDLQAVAAAYDLGIGRGWDRTTDIWDPYNTLTVEMRNLVESIDQ